MGANSQCNSLQAGPVPRIHASEICDNLQGTSTLCNRFQSNSPIISDNFQSNCSTISLPDLLDMSFDLCNEYYGGDNSNSYVLNSSLEH